MVDILIDGMFTEQLDLSRVGGVAIYVKNKFHVKALASTSVIKQFVVGCYRPPSANSGALHSLMKLISGMSFSEIIIMGDLHLNLSHSVSDVRKS